MNDITYIAPAQSGVAFPVKDGDVIDIIDPEGGQVADFMAFKRDYMIRCSPTTVKGYSKDRVLKGAYKADTTEYFSSGRTLDHEGTIYVTTSNTLWTNKGNRMFSILADTAGRHDIIHTPCAQCTFDTLYQNVYNREYHPSCLENLFKAFRPHGVEEHQIPITFNIFMNVTTHPVTGKLEYNKPSSDKGDFIRLQALMDCIVAVASCSSEICNKWKTPTDIHIFHHRNY